MSAIITIEGLHKGYKNHPVLKGLNWTIEQGDVIGLLGKNGAGKSTLLHSLLNLMPSDSDNVHIFGEKNSELSADSKARIGFVPQVSDELPWMSVKELLNFRRQFYSKWNDGKVEELMARWEIEPSKKVSELSPGQAQRVSIILALAHEPDLMIFDEPASALDPAGRRDFLKELVLLAAEGDKTVIFSTHITSDLERVANKVAILHDGVIKHFADLDEIKENVVKLTVHSEFPVDVPYVIKSRRDSHATQFIVDKLDMQWKATMEQQGARIDVNPMGLEDIFLEVTV